MLFSVLKITLSIPEAYLIFCHVLVKAGVNAYTLLKGIIILKNVS